MDFSATPRAGTDALLFAHRMIDQGGYKNILILASDTAFPGIGRERSDPSGHAGCAILVSEKPGIAEIRDGHSYSHHIAENFEYKGNKVKLDPRFGKNRGFKTAIKKVWRSSGLNEQDPRRQYFLINSGPFTKDTLRFLAKNGVDTGKQVIKDRVMAGAGYTGAVHGLLNLTGYLDQDPGKQDLVFMDYVNGFNFFKIRVEKEAAISPGLNEQFSRAFPVETYQDYLALREAGSFDSSRLPGRELFTSEMMQEREKENLLHLKGDQCSQCGSVYFLKAQRCKHCKSEEFKTRKLSRSGEVFSFTREHFFPRAFPPVTMAVVDLDGGGRMTLQLTDDLYPQKVPKDLIGLRVNLVLRKMVENENRPDYFWKCTPAGNGWQE